MKKIDGNKTKEFRAFQSKRMKEYLANNPHPTEGRERSEKFKANQSRVMKDFWSDNTEHREKVQKRVKHIPSGRIFKSITAAAAALNVSISTVSYHCSGRYKTQKFTYSN